MDIPSDVPDRLQQDLFQRDDELIREMFRLKSEQERYRTSCADQVSMVDCQKFRDQLAKDITRYTDKVEAFNRDVKTILESGEYRAKQHLRGG
jgi:hypothetical protein